MNSLIIIIVFLLGLLPVAIHYEHKNHDLKVKALNDFLKAKRQGKLQK